jgi:hypothetical protein
MNATATSGVDEAPAAVTYGTNSQQTLAGRIRISTEAEVKDEPYEIRERIKEDGVVVDRKIGEFLVTYRIFTTGWSFTTEAWYEKAWGPKIYSWKMNWLCKGGCTVPGGSMRKVSGLSNKRVGNGFVQGKDADYNFLFLGGSIRTSRGTLGMPEFPFPRTMKCRVEVTQACFFEE